MRISYTLMYMGVQSSFLKADQCIFYLIEDDNQLKFDHHIRVSRHMSKI